MSAHEEPGTAEIVVPPYEQRYPGVAEDDQPDPQLVRGLRQVLDGPLGWARDQIRLEVLADPDFAPAVDLSDDAYRDRVFDQLMRLAAKERGANIGFPESVGGENHMGGYVTIFETLGMGDLSLLVKLGVQFGLFGGAVQHLGSDRHREQYLRGRHLLRPGRLLRDDRDRARLQRPAPRHHRDLRPGHCEFVVHTPDRAAWKDYIGNARSTPRWPSCSPSW